MRSHNSVGGYRIYPSSPQVAEFLARGSALIGQFNEGMDRLNTARQLTERQRDLVDQLDPNSENADNHRRLIAITNRLWQLALEKQQILARHHQSDHDELAEMGERLILCANLWHEFKHQLDEHA